ncbi:uncharacterized protein CTRU02_205187 [Colletotrichum truncatum]|uniref:Uncharacterized protein n=1 Tax=Colletotrichum truncatum TaxID=5467 RepID=A0ACC3Z397_COLTU|nr:uncharacterized protein CTRU02_05991 [Colletotrichum truncatum]KAF6793119.1 hypothetical protein CTRU02_05991 [Colletotrichum truncatum]
MANNSFPRSIESTTKEGDHESILYAETDNGWTHDGRSDFGHDFTDIPPGNISSDIPDLIDLSDPEDSTPSKGPTESIPLTSDKCNLKESIDCHFPVLFEKIEGPSSKESPHPKGFLDPESPPFEPSKMCLLDQELLPSCHSSDTDGRQNRTTEHDQVAILQAHIKTLENEHETLKRENDSLSTVNEVLQHKTCQLEVYIETLRDTVAEAQLLRTRAQKFAVELSEKNANLRASLNQLQNDYDEVKPQVAEYKKKLHGATKSIDPLQKQPQDVQNRLLNVTEHVREIEHFFRNDLDNNPQDIEAFASVGLFPSGAGQKYDSAGFRQTQTLISSNEFFPKPMITSCARLTGLQNNGGGNKSQGPQPVEAPNDDFNASNMNRKDSPSQPGESQSRTGSTLDGIEWSPGSGKIWATEVEKVQAVRNHQGARPDIQTPSMFRYGIRFVRQHIVQKLITEDGIPDVASRRIIMSGVPEGVHIRQVLEHVRGGRVLKAHIITMGDGTDRHRAAYIEFGNAGDAMDYYRFTRRREFGFIVDDASIRARIMLPATDSFPLSDIQEAQLAQGCTRCLAVSGFPVFHLPTLFESAGAFRKFADNITHFSYSDDGSFEISFSDIQSALGVRDSILCSSFYGGTQCKNAVVFKEDPCDAPLDTLQVPFLPIKPLPDFSILDPKIAPLFMTEEGQDIEVDHAKRDVTGPITETPRVVHEQDLRKGIVWEKAANWDEIPTYDAYDHEQRRVVSHQKDPESGAIRTLYHGSWVMSPDESRKMWLHYNQDSPDPWTQGTADLFYNATGDIDMRKCIVDDGGLYGDADQWMKTPDSSPPEGESLTPIGTPSTVPPLSELTEGLINVHDTSRNVPAGVYSNNIGSNSGYTSPSS